MVCMAARQHSAEKQDNTLSQSSWKPGSDSALNDVFLDKQTELVQNCESQNHGEIVKHEPKQNELQHTSVKSENSALTSILPSWCSLDMMQDNSFVLSGDESRRPRSFSDVSLGRDRQSILKTLQQKLKVERKPSMKVLIQRESRPLSGDEIRSTARAETGKVLSLDDLTSRNFEETCEPPPPKPALPKDYKLRVDQQLWRHDHRDESRNLPIMDQRLAVWHPSAELHESHLQNKAKRSSEQMTGFLIGQSQRTMAQRPHRSSTSDLPRFNTGVLYRHFDPKMQSELLKKELEVLRTSHHVRRKSATMRIRLEGHSRPKSTGDLHVRFEGGVGNKQEDNSDEIGAYKMTGVKEALQRGQRDGSELLSHVNRKQRSESFRAEGTRTVESTAFPQSGAVDRKRVSAGKPDAQTHVSRIDTSQRGQDLARSKSATGLRKVDNSQRSAQDLKRSVSSGRTNLPTLSTQVRRQHNIITKSNFKEMDRKREKVRTRFQQQGHGNRDRLTSSDASDGDPALKDSPKKLNLTRTSVPAVGDNRSDEEKYAALSRQKFIYSKLSSLDTHLEIKSERTISKEQEKAQPKVLRQIQSAEILSENIFKSGAAKTEDLTDSDAHDTTIVYSDSECVIDKGAKNGRGRGPTHGSKIVLRQCRLGSDLVFGLVGVQNTSSKKPNGNGYLDGQGLVTIRMIPDEQGRFGFNVKGGADQGMPIIVSRVAPNTPADNAIPRLNEGDQVLFINGRDVSQHTHEQVVMFIRASRETHSGELILKVRPNAYSGEDSDEPDFVYDPETHQISSATSGANALDLSLKLLEESLESGAALAQFEQLYRKKPGMTMNAARLEANVPKNRYRDISPYDQTRVLIKDSASGDYINANYVNMEIPVSGILNRYIAAQGPLPTTCVDFWQMVWEQQSTLVVMLTTKVERGRIKCHQYWPDLYETSDYGHLQITCVKEEETPSFAFREFNLTHVEAQEERHISHMQYIAWPDHGVPDDPADFLDFVQKVRQRRIGLVEPVIVHCSAGIGRTGVLITMETAMCLIEANQPVYPLSIVRQMRDQRAMLIQTPNQYKFVCEAIIRCYNEGIVKPLAEYQQR